VTVGFCAAGPAPDAELAAANGSLPADSASTGLVSTLLVEPRWGRRGHGGRLLEVGSGSGDFLLAAADLGYEVTGVEYSPYACERTRSLLGGRRTVIQGEIQDVSHQETSFDVCVLNESLNTRETLVRSYRVSTVC